MIKNFDDMQKIGKDNMDASMKSFGAVSKSFQAIAVEDGRLRQEGVRRGHRRRREARRRQVARQGDGSAGGLLQERV